MLFELLLILIMCFKVVITYSNKSEQKAFAFYNGLFGTKHKH